MNGAPQNEAVAHEAPGFRLRAEIVLHRGSFTLDAAIDVEPGEVLGVIGPNGAGKTSLLDAIAGGLSLSTGVVRIGSRELARATIGARGVHLPRAQRRIGYLDQRARLFPHLSARENIAFGPRAHGARRDTAHRLADEWLVRVGLEGRGNALAHELSGGQQQRVAIARIFAAAPALMLLDEPFAALDAASAGTIRGLIAAELARLRLPAIMVTHDAVDLLALADRVSVLEHGRVVQFGAVAEVLGAPQTYFAASFAGRVLVSGTASNAKTLRLANGPLTELRGHGKLPSEGTPAVASFEPTAVQLSKDGRSLTESGSQCWRDTVGELTVTGNGLRITGGTWAGSVAEIPLSLALTLNLEPGAPLFFTLPESAVRFAPAPEAISER
jgi:molybdate transport system ATP-binding protein